MKNGWNRRAQRGVFSDWGEGEERTLAKTLRHKGKQECRESAFGGMSDKCRSQARPGLFPAQPLALCKRLPGEPS